MGPGLFLLPAAFKAIGSLIQGVQANRAGKTQAEFADLSADLITAQGALRQTALRRKMNRAIGAQQAWYGANNTDPSFGAPLLLAGASAAQGELDMRLIQADADLQSTAARFDATNLRRGGRQQLIAGIFGAGTAMLEGFASSGWSPGSGIASRSPSTIMVP